MKRSAVCVAILLAAVLLSSVLAPSAFAPPNDKPEKLNITGTKWNPPMFTVSLTAQYGIAQAADHSGFFMVTTLEITTVSGDPIVTLYDKRGIVRLLTPSAPVPGEPVPIEGPSFTWKPDKPYGKAYATVTVQLHNSNGNPMGIATTEVVGIEI